MESGGASPMPSSTASPRVSTPSQGQSQPHGSSGLNPNSSSAAAPKRVKICVYCGSSPGTSPAYMQAARDLGRLMAESNIDLVYGGGTVGLMGEVAKSIVAHAGPDAAHGIIPEALVRFERDGTYGDTADAATGHHVPAADVYGRTTVVRDMHTRKQMMAREVLEGAPGSGFVALPGGYGTMEELLETVTWNQLGIHSKGVCILNVAGFYDGLLQLIRKSVEEGFVRPANADILVTATDPQGAIDALRDYKVSGSRYALDWESQ